MSGQPDSQWVYDTRGFGLLASHSRNGGTKTYFYDALYRPSSVQYTALEEPFSVQTHYDANLGGQLQGHPP